MKIERMISAPYDGVITKVHLPDKTMVTQDDMVVELKRGVSDSAVNKSSTTTPTKVMYGGQAMLQMREQRNE